MRTALSIGALASTLCWICPAHAQTKAPFYQGKTITMVINFSAGGPTDTEARLVARHLADHIPGHPTILAQNMGGAGGAIGVNYVGQVAPKDGLTVAYTTGIAFVAALQQPSVKVDLTQMPLVAAGSGVSVVYIRSDAGGGVKTPADIMSKSDFWIAGLSPDSDKDLRMRLQFDLLGLKYHYLTGYPGTSDIRLAIQRNEVQATAESMPAYRASVEPLVAKGEITPLWFDDPASGGASRSPDTAGIPATSFLEFLHDHAKPDASSLTYRAFSIANTIGTQLQRLILLPKGSPPEAVAALQAGFAGLANDPDFERDATTTIKFTPRFAEGERVDDLVRSSLKPDPAIVDFLHKYIEEGEAGVKK